MSTNFTLQDAIDLATFGHRHQTDKAGMPYIQHPLRVLEAVKTQGAMPYVQMAAVLHDLTEDQPFTPAMLIDLGVPEAAVDIVRLVDRDESKIAFVEKERWRHSVLFSWEDLDENELRSAIANYGHNNPGFFNENAGDYYYEMIRANPGAVQVKKADIGDNTQPWRLEYLSPDTQARLRTKYAKALEALG